METKALNSWQSIQQEVLQRIQSGVWSPGSVLPTETELAAEFDCSRSTVSRALTNLSNEGLLEWEVMFLFWQSTLHLGVLSPRKYTG